MDIKNCRICGKIMQYSGFGIPVCMGCKKSLEEKFQIAKQYVRENPGTTINELAKVADVPNTQITQWVREERLIFAEDSPIGIDCERCGKMIKSGRYCPECKNSLMNELSSGRKTVVAVQERKPMASAKGRMRYLDRD